jgi:hypothetical protein
MVQIYAHLPGHPDRPIRATRVAAVDVESGQTGDEAVACTLRPVQRWSTEGFIFTDDTFVIDAGFYCGDPAVIMKKCQTIARD